MEVSKSLMRKTQGGAANFGRVKFSSSPFASKMSLLLQTVIVTLNELNCSCLRYDKDLINRA